MYEIIAPIGAGGMGEVYKARDTSLGRTVAVKIVGGAVAADLTARDRLAREARAVASLTHPNICALHGVGETDGTFYVAMEYVEGRTLRAVVESGALPPTEVARIGTQIADALSKAHGSGILHRDIKPENVVLSDDGYVKVLDFGLAKAMHPGGDLASALTGMRTAPGLLVGTLAYMSPEQVRGESPDARSDLFSLGLVLYELATGRKRFETDNPLAALEALAHRPLALDGIDAPLAAVVERATRKDRNERYQSARELSDALRCVEFGAGRPAPPMPERPRVRLLAMGLGAAVLVALIAAVYHGLFIGALARPGPAATDIAGDVAPGGIRVAVLPFENLTRAAGDEWLSGAFADSLTLGLQPVTPLILVSREGVTQLYARTGSKSTGPLDSELVAQLARSFDITYYVHGGYQRVGQQIRVVARLVDAVHGTIRAQESETDDMARVLDLEDRLARRFASSFPDATIPTGRAESAMSLEGYRALTDARRLYAEGRWQQAVENLQAVVNGDPQSPPAWALLGKSYARLAAPAVSVSGSEPKGLLQLALDSAQRAVELDPNLYDAFVALALAHRGQGDMAALREAASHARSLNPRLAEAYALLGDSYTVVPSVTCPRGGDGVLMTRYYRQALEIDPGLQFAYRNLTTMLAMRGLTDEALDVANEGLRRHPDSRPIRRGLASVLATLGRMDEAERVVSEAMAGGVPTVEEELTMGAVKLARGDNAGADRLMDKALDSGAGVWVNLNAAAYYLRAQRRDRALDGARAALDVDPGCAGWLRQTRSPLIGMLRDDAAIAAMLLGAGSPRQ